MAESVASMSSCVRLKVGCLVVTENDTIVIGYNGTPSGWDNVCETEDNVTHDYVLHAEANAISKFASSTESSRGSTVFVTHVPCIHCAKLIAQAKVKAVYYLNDYRDEAGKKHLIKCGIHIERISIDD